MPAAKPTFIDNTDDLKHATASLSGRGLLALDLETEGLDPHSHKVLLLAIGDDKNQLLVDCRKTSLEPLRPLLEGQVPKVTHNGAFDVAIQTAKGLEARFIRNADQRKCAAGCGGHAHGRGQYLPLVTGIS